MSAPPPTPPGPEDEQRVPLFGSWRAIHTAVIAWAVVVMALLAVFSRWRF